MKKERALVSFDWALMRLLRDKANFDVLEGFVSTLLYSEVRIHRLLESESNKDREDSKMNRVDMLAENADGELLLEVHGESEYAYFQRILFGASKLVTEYIDSGTNDDNIKKVYSINIVYFDLGQGKDFVYHEKTEFRGIHENDVLKLSAFQRQQFGVSEVYQLYPEYYILKVNDFQTLEQSATGTVDLLYFYQRDLDSLSLLYNTLGRCMGIHSSCIYPIHLTCDSVLNTSKGVLPDIFTKRRTCKSLSCASCAQVR